MNMIIPAFWETLFAEEIVKPYFTALMKRVDNAYQAADTGNGPRVFPPKEHLFKAFESTAPERLKVVILGQDPYHGVGQAHGLSFSVPFGVEIPKSLQNIYKELYSDLGITPATHGNLGAWARDGVLLLNRSLTVYEGDAGGHLSWGWENFTDAVLLSLSSLEHPIVFVLWGKPAQSVRKNVDLMDSPFPRLVLEASHPSPLGAYRSFWGSKPFSKINDFLVEHGAAPVVWVLANRGDGGE